MKTIASAAALLAASATATEAVAQPEISSIFASDLVINGVTQSDAGRLFLFNSLEPTELLIWCNANRRKSVSSLCWDSGSELFAAPGAMSRAMSKSKDTRVVDGFVKASAYHATVVSSRRVFGLNVPRA